MMDTVTTWTYWIVGPRGRVDEYGRSVEWAEVGLCRSAPDGSWERFVQNRHYWMPSGAPDRRPIEEVDRAEADRLIETWIAMQMTPGRPLDPRPGDEDRA